MSKKKFTDDDRDDNRFDPAPEPTFAGENLVASDPVTKRDGTSDRTPGTEPDPLVYETPADTPHRKGDFSGAGTPAGTPGYDDAGVFDRDRPGWSARHDETGQTVAPSDGPPSETRVEAARRTAASHPSSENLDALIAATRHESQHGVDIVRPNDHTALHGVDSVLGDEGVKEYRIAVGGKPYVHVGEWGTRWVYRPDR
jgi:hypothetical protein